MAFTNLTKIEDLNELVDIVAPLIARHDSDGFGWAALGENGVFGEKMLGGIEMYKSRLGMQDNIVQGPYIETSHEYIGSQSKLIGAGIFHGRFSTNHVSLVNTHPLQKSGWTLIHNGVVTDHGPKYKMKTSNDTEHVLHRLVTEGIKGVSRRLTGYYAVAALDPKGLLHIIRDAIAPLVVAYIADIDSKVFATNALLIEELCEAMEWTCGPMEKVKDNVHLTFNGNNLVECVSFKSRGHSALEAKHASKSLGYEIQGLLDDSEERVATVASKDDYEKFFEEVDLMDSSYEIFDDNDHMLQVWEFRKLSQEEQLNCLIIRPDGTVMTPYNYDNPRLAM